MCVIHMRIIFWLILIRLKLSGHLRKLSTRLDCITNGCECQVKYSRGWAWLWWSSMNHVDSFSLVQKDTYSQYFHMVLHMINHIHYPKQKSIKIISCVHVVILSHTWHIVYVARKFISLPYVIRIINTLFWNSLSLRLFIGAVLQYLRFLLRPTIIHMHLPYKKTKRRMSI